MSDKINDYQKFTRKMWTAKRKKLSLKDYYVISTGLGGETGEVLEILKKSVRDDKLDKVHLVEELGDVLYYLNMVCNYHGIDMNEVIDSNVEKINRRYGKKGK